MRHIMTIGPVGPDKTFCWFDLYQDIHGWPDIHGWFKSREEAWADQWRTLNGTALLAAVPAEVAEVSHG
jgi:hypothetical protein